MRNCSLERFSRKVEEHIEAIKKEEEHQKQECAQKFLKDLYNEKRIRKLTFKDGARMYIIKEKERENYGFSFYPKEGSIPKYYVFADANAYHQLKEVEEKEIEKIETK